MSKFCVSCGAPNDDQATNCSACGIQLPLAEQPEVEVQQPIQPDYQQYYQQPVQQPVQQPEYQQYYQQYYQQPVTTYYPSAQPLNKKTKLPLASIINIPAAVVQLITILYWFFPVFNCYYYYYSYYSYSARSYYINFNIFEFCDRAHREELVFITIIVFLLNFAALGLNVISVLKPKLGNTLMQIPQIAVAVFSYIGYFIIAVVCDDAIGYYDYICTNDGGLVLLAFITLVAIALHVVTLVMRLKDKKEEKNKAMQMSMQMNTPYYG